MVQLLPFYQLLAHLQIILGVPVRVEDDAGICSRQVDSQTSCSGAQQKNEAVGVGFAEPVNGSLSQISSDTAINAFICVAEERYVHRIFYITFSETIL